MEENLRKWNLELEEQIATLQSILISTQEQVWIVAHIQSETLCTHCKPKMHQKITEVLHTREEEAHASTSSENAQL